MKNKEVIITDNDIYSIFKLYKKYTKFKYKNTIFKYDSDKPILIFCTKLLNIKSRLKRIEYIYDNSCEFIDENQKEHNMCDYKCNQCIVQRKSKSEEANGCCRICRFQSTKGCTTSNLSCKFFYCDEIKKHYDVIKMEDVKYLYFLSLRQRIILKYMLFSSKEEILIDLYFSSIILSAFREFYGLFKTSYFLIFKYKNTDPDHPKNNIKYIGLLLTLVLLITWGLLSPQIIILSIVIGIFNDLLNKKIFNNSKKQKE